MVKSALYYRLAPDLLYDKGVAVYLYNKKLRGGYG